MDDKNKGNNDFNIFSFEQNLVELVEELRLRRHLEAESESTLKSIMDEKYKSEITWDEIRRKFMHEKEELEQQICLLKRKLEDKMCVSDDEKAKQQVIAKSYSQEIRALKEELRTIKSEKLNLMKKIQELERNLKLRTNFQESIVSQISDIRKSAKSLVEQFRDLTNEQQKVLTVVADAKLNFTKFDLYSQNLQQSISIADNQNSALKKQLISTRSELSILKNMKPQTELKTNKYVDVEKLQERNLELEKLMFLSREENEKTLKNYVKCNEELCKFMQKYANLHEQLRTRMNENEKVQDELITQKEFYEESIRQLKDQYAHEKEERIKNLHSVESQTENKWNNTKEDISSLQLANFEENDLKIASAVNLANILENYESNIICEITKKQISSKSDGITTLELKNKTLTISEILKRKLDASFARNADTHVTNPDFNSSTGSLKIVVKDNNKTYLNRNLDEYDNLIGGCSKISTDSSIASKIGRRVEIFKEPIGNIEIINDCAEGRISDTGEPVQSFRKITGVMEKNPSRRSNEKIDCIVKKVSEIQDKCANVESTFFGSMQNLVNKREETAINFCERSSRIQKSDDTLATSRIKEQINGFGRTVDREKEYINTEGTVTLNEDKVSPNLENSVGIKNASNYLKGIATDSGRKVSFLEDGIRNRKDSPHQIARLERNTCETVCGIQNDSDILIGTRVGAEVASYSEAAGSMEGIIDCGTGIEGTVRSIQVITADINETSNVDGNDVNVVNSINKTTGLVKDTFCITKETKSSDEIARSNINVEGVKECIFRNVEDIGIIKNTATNNQIDAEIIPNTTSHAEERVDEIGELSVIKGLDVSRIKIDNKTEEIDVNKSSSTASLKREYETCYLEYPVKFRKVDGETLSGIPLSVSDFSDKKIIENFQSNDPILLQPDSNKNESFNPKISFSISLNDPKILHMQEYADEKAVLDPFQENKIAFLPERTETKCNTNDEKEVSKEIMHPGISDKAAEGSMNENNSKNELSSSSLERNEDIIQDSATRSLGKHALTYLSYLVGKF